jgi:pyrimidine operon attenuation protein/uracil phosphoribosyltransferase
LHNQICMKPVTIINSKQFHLTLTRLCYQLIENHNSFKNSVLIGLQPRGIYLAHRLGKMLGEINGSPVTTGSLDITFYRDDFRRREKPIMPSVTNIDFIIEGKKVILVDDVLYTGRTVRAGLDAMLAFGRPESVELLTLIDRRFSRNLPIQPNYIGKTVDSISEERVSVEWKETEGEDKVILFTPKDDR